MTTKELIDKYRITRDSRLNTNTGEYEYSGKIRIAHGDDAKKDGMVDEIIERKQEIIDFLTAEESAKKAAYEDRQHRIDGIEGLNEIISARETLERYLRERRKAIENDGFGWPEKPEYDFNAAYERYPRAHAYLKAQGLADSGNYELSAIGRKAVETIIYGDYRKALATMEEEHEKFLNRHLWD